MPVRVPQNPTESNGSPIIGHKRNSVQPLAEREAGYSGAFCSHSGLFRCKPRVASVFCFFFDNPGHTAPLINCLFFIMVRSPRIDRR
mmetsp:Transcript_27610/g.60981  ORF Transcript_27610/g.60981 Transcript_27610/m.60981 type:complete len:87 (-) Transcript_27610:394-654(-)